MSNVNNTKINNVAFADLNVSHTPSNDAATLTYNNIRTNALADIGQFRTIKDKFGWRLRKSVLGGDQNLRKIIQLDASEIASAAWICCGKDYQLKTTLKNNDIYRFDGFKDSDFQNLQNHAKNYWKVSIEQEAIATEGWNWGTSQVTDKNLKFIMNGKTAFDLVSKHINQVTVSKNDIGVTLSHEEQREDVEDQLLEVRFFVPASKTDDDKEFETVRQAFIKLPGGKNVKSFQRLCAFADLKILVPSGRYDIEMYDEAFKLLGKSHDFIIIYKNITKIYLLPSLSLPCMNLILSLSSPIRKGHTSYHNIIAQFETRKTIDLPFDIHNKNKSLQETLHDLKKINEEINEHSSEQIESQTTDKFVLTGEEYILATRILKELTKQIIIKPGKFLSSSGKCCLRLSYKAESGSFYPLDTSFLFMPKPIIIVNYSEIGSITFGRMHGSQTKFCEFNVTLKDGQTLSFSSMDRQESVPLINFFKVNNVSTRSFNEIKDNQHKGETSLLDDMSDDSDDEDFEAKSTQEDEDEDEENEIEETSSNASDKDDSVD